MNMQQRLAKHVGKDVKIDSETYTSPVVRLQRVYRYNWFKADGVNYVSQATNQIYMLGAPIPVGCPRVWVRTTFEDGLFEARYVCKGNDFVELIRPWPTVGYPVEEAVVVMPMENVVGLQFA